MSSSDLPDRASLGFLKKLAKQRLREMRRMDPRARLSAAQLAVARDHGFSSWRALKAEVDRRRTRGSAVSIMSAIRGQARTRSAAAITGLAPMLAWVIAACGAPGNAPAASTADQGAAAALAGQVDALFIGGTVYDGSGGGPFVADVVVRDGRIAFIGDSASAGATAADTFDVRGLWVTPGFIDMHSHAELHIV